MSWKSLVDCQSILRHAPQQTRSLFTQIAEETVLTACLAHIGSSGIRNTLQRHDANLPSKSGFIKTFFVGFVREKVLDTVLHLSWDPTAMQNPNQNTTAPQKICTRIWKFILRIISRLQQEWFTKPHSLLKDGTRRKMESLWVRPSSKQHRALQRLNNSNCGWMGLVERATHKQKTFENTRSLPYFYLWSTHHLFNRQCSISLICELNQHA